MYIIIIICNYIMKILALFIIRCKLNSIVTNILIIECFAKCHNYWLIVFYIVTYLNFVLYFILFILSLIVLVRGKALGRSIINMEGQSLLNDNKISYLLQRSTWVIISDSLNKSEVRSSLTRYISAR